MGAVTLTNQGPGNLYLFVRVRRRAGGYGRNTTRNSTANNQGMNVTREWLDDKGNPIDITKVKQNDLVVARITLEPNGHSL